jgi:preprotein translocase subunit SecA
LQITREADMGLPELPDFMTSHIDPFTGLDDSYDGDGSSGREAMFGTFAGSPFAEVGPGGAATDDPYADLGLSRNATCPCGSGKKYKHCHGAIA